MGAAARQAEVGFEISKNLQSAVSMKSVKSAISKLDFLSNFCQILGQLLIIYELYL